MFDPVAAELAFGWVFDVLDARVLVFEPRLPDEPGDLARAARLGLRVEHEFDFLLEPHVVVGFVVDDLAELVAQVVPEVLRKSGLARCQVGFSRLPAWCHRVGTCPGSGGSTNR